MKIRYAFYAITLIFLATSSVFATDNSKSKNNKKPATHITGQVTDICNGEPLVGVRIAIEGSNKIHYTDFEGKFQIPAQTGAFTLNTSLISYKTKKVTIQPENFTGEIQFALESL